jgi:L-ascorbate metabolism protein UlaG (beta-lactamase superfamily)
VLRQARQIGSLARFLGSRQGRERDDADAQRELEATPLGLPPGLDIEWLGVAGYRLTYQGHTLLIDPYFSRVSLASVIRRERALPDPELLERALQPPGEVVGVLVGHTHFDHAVDTPAIARRFGCPALGSASLARLMRLHGLGEQAVEVEPHRPYELGPFKVSFVPSRHSKLLLGLAVPFAGELTCEHLDSLSPSAYRCGQVWGVRIEVGGATLYHQGSADLIDEEIARGQVDVFLAGVAGRSFTPDYWKRILTRLDPNVVLASHYDDFFRPYAAPMGFSLNVNLTAVPEEIAAVSRDIAVATLPPPSAPQAPSQ